MNTEFKDFISIHNNVYSEGYCQHLINEFERLEKSGAGSNRQQSENALKHNKNDLQLGLNFGVHNVAPFNDQNATNIFFNGLQQCYDIYTNQFSVLKNDIVRCTSMKMQRTDPGGGYHIWHSEQGGGEHSRRVLAYMLFLNTLDPSSAGETEFLYQRLRIPPEENTMLIWPAAYTHAHRGNTVFGNTSKYIVTGWFYYE
jgi:hypothetical protein